MSLGGGSHVLPNPDVVPADGMVWIEPGTFVMGSPTNDVDRLMNEGPQTTVTISRGFWMGRFEVTQAFYQEVIGTNPSKYPGDLNRPVEWVTHADADTFCVRLTLRERDAGNIPSDYAYRLPTEAEWEYACRAGTTTRFSYGDDPDYANLYLYAWYGEELGGTTHPVGQKRPNLWGLYDMHGNVWEWCSDWYSDNLPGRSVTDPTGPESGSNRVYRGGGWDWPDRFCRSAVRWYASPVAWIHDVGFRVVLAPVQ